MYQTLQAAVGDVAVAAVGGVVVAAAVVVVYDDAVIVVGVAAVVVIVVQKLWRWAHTEGWLGNRPQCPGCG